MALVKPSMTAPVSSYASTASATMTLMLALTYALEAAPNSLQAPVVKCQPSGTLKCNGKSYTTYECSPPVTSSTKALLTLNDFSNGGDGGGPSEFDENYQEKAERVVALSTGWYNGGSRCGKMIRITASNGKGVTAKVVDECDSMNGCDGEHAGQPPCRSKVVHGSDAVRNALGLNKDLGVEDVTWSMA